MLGSILDTGETKIKHQDDKADEGYGLV
jgi:hypothetical protein